MTTHTAVLQKDNTGLSPNNHITGEAHSPAPGALRLVIPRFGAFFVDSLLVTNAANHAPVAPEHYVMGDAWESAQQESGKAVVSCFMLKPSAPVDVEISYQAFGGPASRNARELVLWLQEHMVTNSSTTNYFQLKDIPDHFIPSEHKHLLAHVFGMEFITNQLQRLNGQVAVSDDDRLEIDYQDAKLKLVRMATGVDTTVSALLSVFWDKWKEQISLYSLGVDLLKDYPALGASGAYAAEPLFAVTNPEDERYVDIAGLGAFSKAFTERLVLATTGLGLDLAQEREAQRGSFIGALVGEVFYLPSPKDAKVFDYVNLSVYPKNWNINHGMVVVKQMGHAGNYGGVFSAFDPINGNQFIGLLANDTWQTPLMWQQVYHSDETTAIAEALQMHLTAKGAVHEETKAQIGLKHIENMPVVSEDVIVTRETVRNYLTYDALMAFVRVHQEAIKLARDAQGEVDYNDTMDKTRVIINAGSCGQKNAPKDQFISSFCDGSDKYVRMTDGLGGYYDKLQENNSTDCGHAAYPAYGTKVSEFCEGVSLKTRFSDGKGGYFTETTQMHAEACGYVKPMTLGTVISVFCSGVDQMTRYADGRGGSYDLPTQINTYLCGGTIYPSAGTGTGGGGGTGTKSLRIVSSHTIIRSGASEILTFYVAGLVPNASYSFDIMVSCPKVNNGNEYSIFHGSFNADTNGMYVWEQTRVDDGVTTKRGVYSTWVTIESVNLSSNKITRSFSGEAGSTDPDVPVDPNDPRPERVNKVEFSSDKTVLYIGTNETLTVAMTGFAPDTTYRVRFMGVHPEFNSGVPIQTLQVNVTTNSSGGFTYRISQYNTGTIPNGVTTNWVEVDTATSVVKSNTIVRTFDNRLDNISTQRELKSTMSHSAIYLGTAYTHSVVLTGAAPNTKYTLEIRRSDYTGTVVGDAVLVNSGVVTSDGAGTARLDYSAVYDGVNPPPKSYQFYARLVGADQTSTLAEVTFINKNAPSTDAARITFASDKTVLKKGVVETLTALCTNFPPSATYEIQHWNKSPNYNGGQDVFTYSGSVRIGSDGTGTHSVTTIDDGIVIPRGDYQTWAVIPEVGITSNKITRSFIAEVTPAPTTAPVTVVVTYTTNLSNITPGSTEIHSLVVTGLTPNSTQTANYYISGPALNNGMQPLRTRIVTITANSQGRAEHSFSTDDDGITMPRGTYKCWVEVGSAVSPSITRTFTGTPPPAVQYNPVITYTKTYTTLSNTTPNIDIINLTGMKVNTSYTIDVYIQGANAFGGQPVRTTVLQLVTDANGKASWRQDGYIEADAFPRGTYTQWAEITSLGIRSTAFSVTWLGGPVVTAPPYNPSCRYYTDLFVITAGSRETHTVAISGMHPNRSYDVQVYTRTSEAAGGVTYAAKLVKIQTDASGQGQTQFVTYDDGVGIPRGTYTNWAVILETSTSSSIFSRVFA